MTESKSIRIVKVGGHDIHLPFSLTYHRRSQFTDFFSYSRFFGCAITLYGVFAIPTNMGKTAQYAWFFICYTLLNAVFYTANNIAYAALTSLVTKNSKERVQMGSFRFMFSFGTNLAIQSITVGAVELLGNGAAAWRIIALIYCVIGIITNTLAVFSVKELPEEELKSNGSMGIEDDKLSFKQTVKLLFENKYFSMICVIYILQQWLMWEFSL